MAVVANGVHIVRTEPTVTATAVVLDPPTLVRVVGIAVSAALEVGCERVRLVARPGGVEVGETRLPAVGVRQPTEEVIERPVLHHHEDHVLEAGGRGVRDIAALQAAQQRCCDRLVTAPDGERAGRRRGTRQEAAARHVALSYGRWGHGASFLWRGGGSASPGGGAVRGDRAITPGVLSS